MTFKWKLVSKTLITFFQDKSKGTLSLICTERRCEWEALPFSCLSDVPCSTLLWFAVLLRTLVLYYKQANAQANLRQLFPVCCSTKVVFMIMNPRVRFMVLVLLQHVFVLSLCKNCKLTDFYMKAFLSLTRLAKLS